MNRIARPDYNSRVSAKALFLLLTLFVVVGFMAVVLPLQATSIATGSISVTNFTISPASGTVMYTSPWTAQAFAQAQNSLCGCDTQFNSSLGGTAQADALVAFAQGHALTDGSGLTLSASDSVNIVGGGVMAADAIGQSTLFNTTFSITGGTGTVDVTFSSLVNMSQFLFTDMSGVFAGDDTSFLLSLDGQPLLFMDLANQIGSSSTLSDGFSGSLSDTVTLNFNEDYTLTSTAEDDPYGYSTPEPSAGSLLLLGAGLLAAQRVFVTLRG